ncbi:MAG: hypothetical protein ABIO06_01515 [Pseudolysinimonas sp.]
MKTLLIGIGIWLLGWILFFAIGFGTNGQGGAIAWIVGPIAGIVGIIVMIVGRDQMRRNRAARGGQKLSSKVDDFMS